MTPRSCLRWKPTGRIFKTVGLRWVLTGKIFISSTTKVDSEPPNGSIQISLTNMNANKLLMSVQFKAGSKSCSSSRQDNYITGITISPLHNNAENALQTLLLQIREEFRTSSGPSDSGGNPSPVTIHTWLERFNRKKPRSFEKATASVDAENWISHMEKIFDVMGCEDAFKTRLAVYKFEEFKKLFFLQFFPRAEQERLKMEYHSIRQTNTETSTEFMQRFLRLAGFLGAAAGTEEEQAKNFQWGLRSPSVRTLCMFSHKGSRCVFPTFPFVSDLLRLYAFLTML
uniref:Retrotransposon gag domain-containing protein n=1 Tax=Tanacetum cinerariifolium TaxID=118510 RepID=A0A6L2JI22_TANCI|nr:hypothetical protein [Tanacetum cinerariifolium]